MSTLLQRTPSDPSPLWYSEGVSEESRAIRKLICDYREERRRQASLAWKDILDGEVFEIFGSCSDQGWDGNGAEPISPQSAAGALMVIEGLPEGMRLPAVVPEPDGDISFEWRAEDGRQLSLSVTGQALVYAGIFGGSSRQYGEEQFFGVIPQAILEILARYFFAA